MASLERAGCGAEPSAGCAGPRPSDVGAVSVIEGDLKILKGTYGPIDVNPERLDVVRFVTPQLRELVALHGGSMLEIKESFNGLFGDPCPDENKALTIHYAAKGVKGVSVYAEGTTVFIDTRTYKTYRSPKQSSVPILRVSSATSTVTRVFESQDLLCMICSYLSIFPDRLNCAAVSRRWRDVINENGLTDSFSVGVRSYPAKPCYLDMPISFFKMVLSRSVGQLIVLDLSYYQGASDDLVIPALEGNHSLTSLDLSGCVKLTALSLGRIGPCCRNLVSLTLKRLPAIDDDAVLSIAKYCTALETLDLSDCHLLTDKSIKELGRHLDTLTAFYAKNLFRVTDEGILPFLQSCGENLQVLSLWSVHQITRSALAPFRTEAVAIRLASLNLWECFNLDDEAVTDSICNCINLVDLNLRNNHLLTDRAVTRIAAELPKLEHLDLRYLREITDCSLEAISDGLHRLRSLNLTHCLSITEHGVATICSKLSQLTELRLAHGPGFNDKTVELIAASLQSRSQSEVFLDLLDLRGNPGVSALARELLSTALDKRFVESPRQVFFFDI